MRSQRKGVVAHLALVFVILMLAVLIAGCTETERQSDEKIVVAVTIPPEQEFVERISGDRAQVILLVPPGADPHTYEPPPRAIADLAKADIYATVGSGIEFELVWKDKIASMNPRMLVIDSSRGIDLISTREDGNSGTDPHIWLSPRCAKVMVENIYQGIAEVDPENADIYRRNTDAYIDELDALDREIAEALAVSGVKRIMVYHPSWAYFAREYGLEQIPIESEGKEPSPRGIEHLIAQAKEEHIKVIFASPEYSTRSAEVIASEISGNVVLVSPLAKDYLANMRHVATAFAGEEGS